MLSTCAQVSYPYHFQNLVSNDQLYGADPKFINEIDDIATSIVEELLTMMQAYSDKVKLQCSIALELFERVATKTDLSDDEIFKLALKLWNLTIKNRQVMEPKLHLKMLRHLEFVKESSINQAYQQRLDELINRIKTKL